MKEFFAEPKDFADLRWTKNSKAEEWKDGNAQGMLKRMEHRFII